MKKIKKAVLPVAGAGTRFLPATKAIPKELLPIVDKPVIQLIVEEAVASGITEIIFVTNPGKDAIRKYFEPDQALERLLQKRGKTAELAEIQRISKLAKFHYVEQTEPLGDGHAILQARELIGEEPFLVLFGDDIVTSDVPATKQLIETWEQHNTTIIALQKVEADEVGSYGIVKPKKIDGSLVEIADFIEKPQPAEAPSNLAIIGKYICLPEIFDFLAKCPNRSGEIRLIDAFSELVKTQTIFGKVIKGQRYDTGDKFGFVKATLDAALTHPDTSQQTKAYLKKLSSQT